MKYKVKIRRTAKVKPGTECIDGKVYDFGIGWEIEEDDSSLFVGEYAMISRDSNYPEEAPVWVASGDLEEIDSDAGFTRTHVRLI